MDKLKKLAARLAASAVAAQKRLRRCTPRGLLATSALAAIAIGLWWERPSLALIIPGTFVLAALAWSHLMGKKRNA